MSWIRGLAVATVPLGGLAVAAWVTGAATAGLSMSDVWPASAVVAGAPGIVLGNVVAKRQPDNPVGALLAWSGLQIASVGAGDAYTWATVAVPGRLPVSQLLVSLSQGAWMWLYIPIALLLLFFPTGRLLSRRWRVVAVGLPLTAVAFMALTATAAGPYLPPFQDSPHVLGTAPREVSLVAYLLLPVFLALLIASAVSMVLRYRRARGVVRTQVKWFALAGLTLPLTLLLAWTGYLFVGKDLVGVGLLLFNVAVPATITVAIVRHDLFDIDRIISAAVTSGLASAGVLTVYVLASTTVGLIAGSRSTLATAVAATIAVVALAPAHRAIKSRVDRRLYPRRQRTLAAIERLRHQTHAGTADPEQLQGVLRVAMDDPGLQVGYLVPGDDVVVDYAGHSVDTLSDATVVAIGEHRIGSLQLSQPCSRALAGEVAAAAALLIEVVRLRLHLGRALGDAESSRARLLSASYEERRRVVRDLHDGSQQRLVSLGMSLRLAQRHLQDGTVDVDGLLEQSVAELGAVVAELRQLANGLRPSCLDDGLDAALRQLTSAMPFSLDLDLRAGVLTDDVSTTAYYVACEALANAVKHAEANRLGLAVVQRDGSLHIRVSDDGQGGASVREGGGLPSLADRVAAHGGSLTIQSPAGLGTIIEARLPCAS